jgi:acyl-CoA dehydrogenase family protein 9
MQNDHNEKSIACSLFLGQIETSQLTQFPVSDPQENETLSIILETLEKYLSSEEENFRLFDKNGAQSDSFIEELKQLGLFGLIVPEEYGGLGLSNAAYARVLQLTSSFDASTSLTIGAHSSIGMKGLLLFGNKDQKSKYLPLLASGENIAAFCLTEPGSGSDAASIRTHATKNEDGTWTLNGEKIWITNGAFAKFFTVFARTDTEEGKLSAFIIEKDFAGVSSGPKEDKLGIRASATTSIRFDNVRVPSENLLGQEGKGFKMAMEILNNGRTGLGGGCVGGMKRMIKLSIEQAKQRKQFGKSISEYELIKEKIAQMTIKCFATESVVRMVSHMIDSGHKNYSVEAAMSKVFATESLWYCVNEALQIAGGNGYMKEYPYERYLRDSRINMIFEGTNEILRLYIGLTGLKDVGEYLKDVLKSASSIFNEPIKGFGILSNYVGSKISQKTMLGIPELEVPEELKEFSQITERMATSLARVSEKLVKTHKKDIVEKQLEVKRVAEIALSTFISLCVITRVKSRLPHCSENEKKTLLNIVKCFTLENRRTSSNLIRRIEKGSEDIELNQIANFILEESNFPWDSMKEGG